MTNSMDRRSFKNCQMPDFTMELVSVFFFILAMLIFFLSCENMRLQEDNYHLKTHMFATDMGGCDIVLGEKWLHTLGPVNMDFKELYT